MDQHQLVHDVIKHAFARHGLVVTMSPRPVPCRQQSTGQHTHVSLEPPDLEEPFLTSILRRRPPLCALCLPHRLSYERVQPSCAGTSVAWGTGDRSGAIRKVKAAHWEIRCVDATSNMYLALAAILAAGIIGCSKSEPLLWRDTTLAARPGTGGGGGEPLPRSIDEALERLGADSEELEAALESQVIRHYLRVKRFEASKVRDMDPEEVRELMEVFGCWMPTASHACAKHHDGRDQTTAYFMRTS